MIRTRKSAQAATSDRGKVSGRKKAAVSGKQMIDNFLAINGGRSEEGGGGEKCA